jgi:hypothetical protein
MNDSNSHTNNNLDQLPWIDLYKVFSSEAYAQRVESIPNETLQFAADPDNREFLINSARKSLKQSNTDAIDEGQAEILADLMSVLARMFLQDRAKLKK